MITIKRSVNELNQSSHQHYGLIIGCGSTSQKHPHDQLQHTSLHPPDQYYTIDIDNEVAPDMTVNLNDNTNELHDLNDRFTHIVLERFPTIISNPDVPTSQWKHSLTTQMLATLNHFLKEDGLCLFILSTAGYTNLKDRNVFQELSESGFNWVLPCYKNNIFISFKSNNLTPNEILNLVCLNSNYMRKYMNGEIITEPQYSFTPHNKTYFPVFFETSSALHKNISMNELIATQASYHDYFHGLAALTHQVKRVLESHTHENITQSIFGFIKKNLQNKSSDAGSKIHKIIQESIVSIDKLLMDINHDIDNGGTENELDQKIQEHIDSISTIIKTTLTALSKILHHTKSLSKLSDDLVNIMITITNTENAYLGKDVEYFKKIADKASSNIKKQP